MTLEKKQSTPPDRKADAMRRLQVGGTGLVLIALLVGLSTLLTSETRQDAANGSDSSTTATGAAGSTSAEDPLTDLGVEPAANEQPAVPAVPAVPPDVDAPQPVGPIVPDLQPDPQLDSVPPQR